MILSLRLQTVIIIGIEAVAQRCSVKKMFLEIWQNSQENICARVSFLIKLQALVLETSKNTFLYRTPLVAASVRMITW